MKLLEVAFTYKELLLILVGSNDAPNIKGTPHVLSSRWYAIYSKVIYDRSFIVHQYVWNEDCVISIIFSEAQRNPYAPSIIRIPHICMYAHVRTVVIKYF